jgi:hypothetical protein
MNNEPVAWMSSQTDEDGDTLTMFSTYNDPLNKKQVPLYTHLAKTLTDEKIIEIYNSILIHDKKSSIKFARAILRKAQENEDE